MPVLRDMRLFRGKNERGEGEGKRTEIVFGRAR